MATLKIGGNLPTVEQKAAIVERLGLGGVVTLTPTGLKKDGADLTPTDEATYRSEIGVSTELMSSNLNLLVPPIRIGSFEFSGGSISVLPSGTWYVGIELSSKLIRCLPRLGHTGWIPIARVVTNETTITALDKIQPVMPKCRIPRAMEKLRRGESIKVTTLGSSLVEGSTNTKWSGMVFGGTVGSVSKYLLPGVPVLKNIGLGGAPNMYSMAQLGFSSQYNGTIGFDNAIYPATLTRHLAPYGRSSELHQYEIVVVALLANGGDYRLESLEPILRILKKMRKEVIVLTDNAQGPSTDFNVAMSAALFTDGPQLMRLADQYGFEIADTAAYVMEAHIRNNGVGIYSDTIHMASLAPNGPDQTPSCGHELWARAIRSLFPIQTVTSPSTYQNFNYSFDADLEGWYSYSSGLREIITNENGRLVCTKTGAAGQWGTRIVVGNVSIGDTVTITGNVVSSGYTYPVNPVIGLQGGGAGWGSNAPLVYDNFNITLTATRDIVQGIMQILVFGNWDAAPVGTWFSIDNITITISNAGTVIVNDVVPDRQQEVTPLPKPRRVTDMKTPGDMVIQLPHQESRWATSHTNRGTMEAHPAGAESFARRFSSAVASNQDLLVLTTGKEAGISAVGAVSFGLILYSVNGNGPATIEILRNSSVVKTMTIAAQTLTREVFTFVLSPNELNVGSFGTTPMSILIRCTAGTVRIAAFVAQTAEVEILSVLDAKQVGTWSGLVNGGGSGLLGIYTDTVADYLKFKCPEDATRVSWLISGRPNSKAYSLFTGSDNRVAESAAGGVSHVRAVGGSVISSGSDCVIQCADAIVGGGDSANGYSLHVGGIAVVYDR